MKQVQYFETAMLCKHGDMEGETGVRKREKERKNQGKGKDKRYSNFLS